MFERRVATLIRVRRMSALPPCGFYKTTQDTAGVPAGRLVYFHNHGEPGPGVYLPQGWSLNRAQFGPGQSLKNPAEAFTLEPLASEGFYRVREAFFCCEKQCRRFEPELLVQLGYNGQGDAILFVPELTPHGMAIPERGSGIDRDRVKLLAPLVVASSAPAGEAH